jgi:hypothetical protein
LAIHDLDGDFQLLRPSCVNDVIPILVHTPSKRYECFAKSNLTFLYVKNIPFRTNLLTALAPVLEGVELKTSVKMMNATFFPGQNPGFARQFPNPEADAIWEKFELLRTIPITKEDVIRLGKDPEKVAKFDNEYWGLGDNAYMAQVDVFHQ